MEARPTRRRGTGTFASPGRNNVWVEPPGKSHHQTPSRSPPPPPAPANRVAVVYYLCRNRHLEHPHFIEVPLASPEEGLYLRGQSTVLYSIFLNKGAAFNTTATAIAMYERADTIRANGAAPDVINRLNVLRGKGMAAMYSWSCKRYDN
jgi:hypothetical protein